MSISLRQLRRVAALSAASLLLAACAGVAAAPNSTTDNETVKVQRGSLRVSVTGNGTVQPEQSAELNFGTSGMIDKVLVKEGTVVKKGDILATLDPRDLDQQVLQSEANLETAQAKLEQAQNGNARDEDKRAAKASVDIAKAQLTKAKTGNVTRADIDAAQAGVDQAQAQLRKVQQGGTRADIDAAQASLDQAQAQYDKVSAPATPTDLKIAQAAVRQAEAQLASAKINRDKATLRAPFDGIVTTVNVSSGDTVGAAAVNAPITMVDVKQRRISVSIAEADVAQVRQNQPAQVMIDALGSEPITGTVTYIAPAATVVQNVTTYTIRVDLPQDNPAIRVGMNASVAIGVAEKKDVLLIPSSAVRTEGNKHIVRLKTGSSRSGDTFTDTQIRTGLANDVQTEVLSGLKEGDVIAALGVAPVKK